MRNNFNSKAKIPSKIYNIIKVTLVLLGLIGLIMPAGCEEQSSSERHPATPEEQKISSPPEPQTTKTKIETSVSRDTTSVAPPQNITTTTETTATTKPKTKTPDPKISFESTEYDFGDVGPGTINIGKFNFKNIGNAPLRITNIEKCCGTIAKLSKSEIEPGESGTITVQYTAPPRPGIMRRKLYVNSNDKNSPKLMLNIKAKIVQKVDYDPKRLVISLKDNEPNIPKITIFSLDDKPFSITAIDSTNGCITADYDASVQETKFVLQPKANMEKFRDNPKGNINIRLNHPECDAVTIFFEGLTKFKITPPQIMVFNAEPGTPVNRTVWILSNYDEDFEIESTSSKTNTIQVLEQNKVRKGIQFDLQITPPSKQENQSLFTDVFIVNTKGGEKLEVVCRGFYSKK